MKYSNNLAFLFILLVTPVSSCTERMDISLDDSAVRLVVEGSLTTDTMSHKVLLSSTSGYFYNLPPQPVSGATVTISDGENILDLTEITPGVYQTSPSAHGIEGKTYALTIKLDKQIGGFSDYTASSKLYPVAKLDSVNLLYHPDWSSDGIWEVKCFVQDPPSADFYRFLISRNDTMITDTLDEWFVTDDRFFNGNYVNGIAVSYLDQSIKEQRLIPGDSMLVEMNNTGEGYANFLLECQSEIIGSYPLFTGPPANIKGNINNGAIGFFAAYAASRAITNVPISSSD
jgi:Domain of unknown function (DUF4249)